MLGTYAKVKWPLPTGLMAVLVGMVLAWSSGLIGPDASAWQAGLSTVGLQAPTVQLCTLDQPRRSDPLAGGDPANGTVQRGRFVAEPGERRGRR